MRPNPSNRQYRLVIGGKVEGNAGTKGDGDPRQQPSGPGLGAHPFAQLFERARPDAKPGAKTAGVDPAMWRPSPRNALYPATRPAPLSHRPTPIRLTRWMLPRAVVRQKPSGCGILRKPQLL